ncbi:MAG: D-alanyl-D-alanine carboxypeptidase/D-alanyl-D-alanine-endopeptidase [Gemmatimonadales bacterium]|nr:D-alanyl-D-alanine carboxypeptidase/D-alanyl-D-alanine-endopeptidase [Gemmatimonadales bacterium]
MLAVVLAAPARAQDRAELVKTMDSWYRGAEKRARGQWGIAIADQSGRVLWEVGAREPMVPASTVKVLTTGFARTMLGGDARRPTRVLGQGEVDPQTGDWLGTWALELNGDPTLEREELAGPTLADLAQQLRARGIRRLTGPLQVRSAEGPAEASYPSVWSPKHWGRWFAPLVGSLIVRENAISIAVGPGGKAGAPARIVGEEPRGVGSLVTIRAKTVAGRRSRLALSRRDGGGWVLAGTIGSRALPRRLQAMSHDPRAVLRASWAAALRQAGIDWLPADALSATAPTREVVVLGEVRSPTLDSIAVAVNRKSINLGAEALLRWAGGPERPAELLTEHVRTVTGEESVMLVDGSGLSYDDRVSPFAFVQYLARFPATPAGRNFAALLPANGTGTLWRMRRGLPGAGVVRAKTGTLNEVATLVGYLGRENEVLLFSLMYNGPVPWTARAEQWRLFRMLGARMTPVEMETPVDEGDLLGG